MSKSFLKPIAIAVMLAVAPLSISNVQAAAVKVGSYVGIWSAKNSYGAGDLITLNNKTFLSLVARNLNKNPETNTALWQLLGGVGATGLQGPVGAQGIQGLKGDAGLAGASGTGGLKLFDANHNVIGDMSNFEQVNLTINSKIYVFWVKPNGFVSFKSDYISIDKYYTSNDCTGTAYYSVLVPPEAPSGTYFTNLVMDPSKLQITSNKLYGIDPSLIRTMNISSMMTTVRVGPKGSAVFVDSCILLVGNLDYAGFDGPQPVGAIDPQTGLLDVFTLIQDLSVYPTPFTVGKE